MIASLKGPLPKDLTLLVPHGQAIMTGLITGINSKLPDLSSTMANVTHTITGGVGTAAAGGAAGGKMQMSCSSPAAVTSSWCGCDAIRVKGGTGPNGVQIALGQSR